MKVVLAAGGTAGHINPALAIADKIKEIFPESEILFVGTPNGMEASLVKKAGYPFRAFRMEGLQRKLSVHDMLRNVEAAFHYLTARSNAAKLLKEFRPDVVVGTGGYVSAPILLSAAKLGIRTATHESNSLPGVATRLLAKHADCVFVVDRAAKERLPKSNNVIITGNPLRTNIPIEDRAAARKRLGLSDGLTILSFGGSLGANKITESVAALLKWESETGGINHIHGYGGNGREVFDALLKKEGVTPTSRMILREYIDNMYTCMCAADVVISRAGAMTLTELKAIGRASILIPFPKAAENHQYYNALSLAEEKAAVLIEDKDLDAAKLIALVDGFLKDPERLGEMEKNAARLATLNAADTIVSKLIDLTR
ncbi:MAG: undecaprenyldiphospho-muramoylpentapeptide beta-N-acetylglucosaminyltransferase [Bacteroides sp.]|nr:undecaprenyldiphospho-muramoylpentapeptide beta-N-acetylglucosaminyltransferase [Eubacterium sp.]MCM1418324.1 undecaprenyldiphospho-muramoylpentapeptide beta-N-acetylglucosaminyltransferase [Roseburia sp.]MCM1463389.1 undecaprenyldiphospho-muramoylpentapeptide beta-N-acetylglucosaminyltransferase [Bacteroides sp.]